MTAEVHVPDPTEPGIDDLQADELRDYPATPVRMVGPVDVHTLPSRGGSVRSYSVTGLVTADPNATQKVLGLDLRRRSATILSFDQEIRFAYTMTECQAGTAARWPKNVPLSITHCDEVWVRSGEATGAATTVTVAEENWSH